MKQTATLLLDDGSNACMRVLPVFFFLNGVFFVLFHTSGDLYEEILIVLAILAAFYNGFIFLFCEFVLLWFSRDRERGPNKVKACSETEEGSISGLLLLLW